MKHKMRKTNKLHGINIEDLQKEHNLMIVCLKRINKSIDKKNYGIKKLLKKFRVLALNHFLTEDLLIYPILIKIAVAKTHNKTKLYNDKKEKETGKAKVFYVTIREGDTKHEVNISNVFSEENIKQALMSFATTSMETIALITHLEKETTPETIETNKQKLKSLTTLLEDRFSYEEDVLYSRIMEY